MKKEDLVEWIIENSEYLLTVRERMFKMNLYQIDKDYWEIYFHLELNIVTRAGKVTSHGLIKYLKGLSL